MSPKQACPKSWPTDTSYLTSPIYSPTITKELLTALRTQDPSLTAITTAKGPSNLVKITPISLPTHPANGQSGLFAVTDLKPGTFILQYLGVIHCSPEPLEDQEKTIMDPHATSNYDLSLDRERRIGVDADGAGTEARFINDYRGVVDRPNAEFKEIWDERRKERGMGVFVLPEGKKGKGKGIKRGEEILVSYGRGFWGARKGEEGGQ
jgi:hypothetical protein